MKKFKHLLSLVALGLIGYASAQTYPTTQWRDLADTSWFVDGTTSYDFSTAEQLAGLSKLVEEGNNFDGVSFNLVADINLDGHLWTPIGFSTDFPFSGDVDGNNHVISNLWINMDKDFLGVFGQSINASYEDIYLDTANIDSEGSDSGSLVANLYTSTMENCHATNVNIKVLGVNVGGLVGGVLTDAYIKNSSFKGNVTGVNQVGGVAGTIWDNADIIESYSEGTVTGEFIVGGITGFITMAFGPERECTVEDSYSRSNVTATDAIGMAGGAIGYGQQSLIIKNSYSTGTVTAPTAAGGFIGQVGFIVSENCYFDTESSTMTEGVGVVEGPPVSGITAKTTAEMKTQAMADTLNNGDQDPWAFDGTTNDGYPFLGEALGTTDVLTQNIQVYPTVTSNNINVVTKEGKATYQLFNVNGAMVKQGKLNQSNESIQVSELPSGVYILSVQAGAQNHSTKIIKK